MSAAAEGAPPRGTNRFFLVFATVLVVMGIVAAVFGGWRLIDGLTTLGWVETTATVTGAESVRTEIEPGRATRHVYRVTAEYDVDGQRHTITYQTNLRTAEPRVGSTLLVRYDPNDPADARRGAGGADLVVGPLVGVLGIALVIGGLILFRRSRRGPITLPGYHVSRTYSRSKKLGGNP